MMKHIRLIKYLLCFLPFGLLAQEKGEKVYNTFMDTRVVNGHSVESNKEGQMKFIIGHRFGSVNGGIEEFYGLDQSTIRLGFDYGIKDWLSIGIGRSSFEKTLDGFIKARIIHQREGVGAPISVSALSTVALKTIEFAEPERENYFSSRLAYVHQLLIARKFSDRFSLQFMPTVLHRNLVATADEENDVLSLGSATRFQLSKIVSFKAEYYYTLPDQLQDNFSNALSLGFDIETKHHVFQLHVSNSRGMVEKFFIAETIGKWEDGDIMFGFNITRDFQIKGRKYK